MTTDVATKTTEEWLPIARLRVDSQVNPRSLNERKARKLAQEFNPDAIGVIYVSRRANGDEVIIDGQHRVAAMKLMGYIDQAAPCHVYHGLSIEQEAMLWYRFNGPRTKPRPLEIHRALVNAGDPAALAIEAVVEAIGCKVGWGGQTRNTIAAVGSLQMIHRGAGEVTLRRALRVAKNAWMGSHEGFQGDLLMGIGLVISRHPDADDERLAKQLGKVTPVAFLAQARVVKSASTSGGGQGSYLAVTLARQIVALYNKGMRSQTGQLTWVDPTSSQNFWQPAAKRS